MRKIALCVATLATASAVAACGGATVDSDDVTETPTVTEEVTETASSTSSESSVSSSPAPRSSSIGNGPVDQPAREVTEVSPQASAFSPEEEAYLATLRESGVNIDGIEDQLTATGATVCADNLITRDAVAGQLVEQRRTDMDAAGVAALISDTARANLCS